MSSLLLACILAVASCLHEASDCRAESDIRVEFSVVSSQPGMIALPSHLRLTSESGRESTVQLCGSGIGAILLAPGVYGLAPPEGSSLAIVPDRFKLDRKPGSVEPLKIESRLFPGGQIEVALDSTLAPNTAVDGFSLSTHDKLVQIDFDEFDLGRERRIPVGTYLPPAMELDLVYYLSDSRGLRVTEITVAPDRVSRVTVTVEARPTGPFVFEVELRDQAGDPIPYDRVRTATVLWGAGGCDLRPSGIADKGVWCGVIPKEHFVFSLPPSAPVIIFTSPSYDDLVELPLSIPTDSGRLSRSRFTVRKHEDRFLVRALPDNPEDRGPLSVTVNFSDRDSGNFQAVSVHLDATGEAWIDCVQLPLQYYVEPSTHDLSMLVSPSGFSSERPWVTSADPVALFRFRRQPSVRVGISADSGLVRVGTRSSGPTLFYVQPITALEWGADSLRSYTARLRDGWLRKGVDGSLVDLGVLPVGRYRVVMLVPELGSSQCEFEVGIDGSCEAPQLGFEASSGRLQGRIRLDGADPGTMSVVDGRLPLTLIPSIIDLPLERRASCVARVEEDGTFALERHQASNPWLTVFQVGVGAWVFPKAELDAATPIVLVPQPDLGALRVRVFSESGSLPDGLFLLLTSLHGDERVRPDSEPRAEDLYPYVADIDGTIRVTGILPGAYRVGLGRFEQRQTQVGLQRRFQYFAETMRVMNIGPGPKSVGWSLPAARCIR